MPPLAISADHARRFLVRRHLLAPPRSLKPRAQSVLEVVERLGLLQFDPLEVPGARNHDLVLHARIRGYRREWCERWLYGPDRRLIELYNKSLNIVPMHELPHYRITWQRYGASVDSGILKDQADVASAILKRLTADGPLSTAAFSEHGHAVDWWWAPTRASRAVMEALFVAGRIGISRRQGNRRYYDLMERLVSAEQLKLKESEEDAMTHRLLSRFRATGMTTTIGTQGEVMYSAGSQAERIARTERLVASGELLPLEVEGFKRLQYIIAAEEPILRATAEPGSLPPPAVSFLGALDPLVWDRKMLRSLWSFDYLWEVYVPEAKRKWGYYVLP
ncbi:MAG: crosslink repair DNA glycosylase YcaQ family protein, partial [Chloroflexota bacterium]